MAVGTRSVKDQQHRLTVSGMDVPTGMKDPTSGDVSVMLNPVVAAQASHDLIYRGWKVKTTGNPLAHTILKVLHSRKVNRDIQELVKGVMIESYIVGGNQKTGARRPSDSCCAPAFFL